MDLNEAEYISNNFAEHEENKKLKQVALDMMHDQLPSQPELWEKLTPNYPLGCKRVVVSDFFFPALNLPNVDIETRPIHSINDHTVCVVDSAGQAEDADSHYELIVFATGFRATDFLHPMKVFGRNGRALHEMWNNGAIRFNDMACFGRPADIAVSTMLAEFRDCDSIRLLLYHRLLLDQAKRDCASA